MAKEQLDRMEALLTQLVGTVGKLSAEFQEMKEDMQTFKEDQQAMKEDMQAFKVEIKNEIHDLKTDLHASIEKSEERHHEITQQFRFIRIDQDLLWEKTVRHERDLAQLKK
ncbi:hypothetical protein [Bacillus suaedae]|uniref:DUF1640 domain-containing protein n=1 Tax=Halalkalibacter suaedae TaxID=2822140 RepID=A0A940WZ85_9BACI|nr:hypothetical protein [Bacillus suaedae]MBP3953602.1 hypothetical protein [Bacillus suaedae]